MKASHVPKVALACLLLAAACFAAIALGASPLLKLPFAVAVVLGALSVGFLLAGTAFGFVEDDLGKARKP